MIIQANKLTKILDSTSSFVTGGQGGFSSKGEVGECFYRNSKALNL